MNKFEEISAFMDGESGQPTETVLASLKADAELSASWWRYHLIGDAMRRQLASEMPVVDMSQRVSAALDAEPTVLSPRSDQSRPMFQRMLKPAAGAAIAASVALVAIVGLRGLDQATNNVSNGTSTPSVAELNVNEAPATVNSFASEPAEPMLSRQPVSASPLARTVSSDGEPVGGAQQQYGFSNYLINHNEYRASSSVRGSMPYARIVAPDNGDR